MIYKDLLFDINPDWALVRAKGISHFNYSTDYAWYTDGDKHIFILGKLGTYYPFEELADYICYSDMEASQHYNSYISQPVSYVEIRRT
jgi:hypothetical protein